MANWQQYNLNTLFPQEVADATATVANVSGQVADAAETIATAVEALSSLIIDKTDPLKTAIDTLIWGGRTVHGLFHSSSSSGRSAKSIGLKEEHPMWECFLPLPLPAGMEMLICFGVLRPKMTLP